MVHSGSVTAVAWARFQGRTVALAAALGGREKFFGDGPIGGHLAGRPIAYLLKSARTWKALSVDDPRAVVVITPPVFAPLIAWLWCAMNGRVLVVDCHTGAFHSRKWAWARPIHRWLLRRARAVLVHTEELESLVKSWGAPALLVPDDVPGPRDASSVSRGSKPRAVIAGSFDTNEPVTEVIEAARQLPNVEFRFTGDPALLGRDLVASAPANAVFTGYLPYRDFLGELAAADAVGVFSTDPRIMNRSAFEAVGLGRPLVLSDLPALRTRFQAAALFCSNQPEHIAETIALAIDAQEELAARSVRLQAALRAQRDAAVAQLRSVLDDGHAPL